MSEYGDFITNRRIELGYSLRKFCLKFGYDAGNLSKMERGLLNPYSDEKLAKLGIELELGFEGKYTLRELSEKELQPLQFKNRELEQQLKNATIKENHTGEHLISVCEQLKDANEVIDFYAEHKSWIRKGNSMYDSRETITSKDSQHFEIENTTLCNRSYIGGKKAREYKTKYKR